VSGSGTTSLTIAGSLSQVNSDLATLQDTNDTAGSDAITLNATDSFGNSASQQTIAVTVNGLPVITPAAAQTIGVGQAAAIAGVSLSESGDTTGETFTVTLTDAHGLLSASGTGVSGSGSNDLTIAGSLGQVNTNLTTLQDTDGTARSDPITLNATDSFGNAANQETIAVTVNQVTAPTLTTLVSFNGANGSGLQDGLIIDTAADLFGTAVGGGAGGAGTVFEIAKNATGYASTPTVLVSFPSWSVLPAGGGPAQPSGGMIANAAGGLIGTTIRGGRRTLARCSR
jgi:hypothetical protein